MTDQEIADALVDAGVLGMETTYDHVFYTFPGDPHLCPAETWLKDWRVAGAYEARRGQTGESKVIKISGSSDDIVMVDLDSSSDEFYPKDDDRPYYIALSNGMLIRIKYDGRWHIDVDANPNDIPYEHRRATNDDDDYSDVLTINEDVLWLIGGQDRL